LTNLQLNINSSNNFDSIDDVATDSASAARGPDEIGLDAAEMALVEAHLTRLAEDGRAPATPATYRIVAGKLRIKLGGAGRGSHTGADRRGPTGAVAPENRL
jgi:hypothetical protein